MSSDYLYDIFLSSGVYRFFKKLKNEGCIIIIPTTKNENVYGIADEIYEIDKKRTQGTLYEREDVRKYLE